MLLLIAGTAGARHPLEPADTSSPRATIQSFLAITEETGGRYLRYRDSPDPATMDALYQMRGSFDNVLDLSQVPPAARKEVAAEIASPRVGAGSVDAHLIRLAARSIGILAALVLLVRAASEVGVPVYGIVAGAGVSGLAVALAAKTTLENFMGTLNLYADRPVRVGDLCRYGEDPSPDWQRIGHVEEIGLRSTRLRGIDRTVTTVPNADFSNMHLVNLIKRDRMLLATTIQLRYETTRDQLRYLLAGLRELLHAHPRTFHAAEDRYKIRVRFDGFGDYSLNVRIRVYIKTSSVYEFLAIKEDIMFRVMDVVEEAGTGFAFPSRTLYHTRDGGLDHERGSEAEKKVREWVSAQTLPFPDMAEDERKWVTDTLDYPPEGSPGADRGLVIRFSNHQERVPFQHATHTK